jgi:Mce-associated membrane protein
MSARSRTVATVVVLVLLAAAAAVLGVLWWKEHDKVDRADRQERARIDATAAAAKDIPLFANFSYTTLDADKARGRAVLTPTFAQKYDQLFGALIATAQQRKATVTEQVRDAQPVDVSKDAQEVTVLTFFEQTATFGDGAPDKFQPLQYQLTMRRVGGRWLVDDIQVVQ